LVNNIYNSHDFIRTRGRSFIPDVIDSEEKYQELQKKMQGLRWTAELTEIQAKLDKEKESTDVVYLSNIGYDPEISLELAKEAIYQGAEKVICCWLGEDLESDRISFESGFRRTKNLSLSQMIDGSVIKSSNGNCFLLEGRGLLSWRYRGDEFIVELLDHGEGIEVTDIANYGFIAEISAENNPSLANPFRRRDLSAA